MKFKTIKAALLASTASGALLGLAYAPAQAQIYSTGPGFYLSVEGRYLMNRGDKVPEFDNALNPQVIILSLDQRADKGWGGKAMLGYRFAGNWDVGVGLAGNMLKGRNDASTTGVPSVFGVRSEFRNVKVKLDYQVADFEAGYNMSGANSNVRLFGGLRLAHFAQKAHAVSTTAITGFGTAFYNSRRKTTFSGAGPRLGINGQFGLGNSGFNLFGGLSGAVLAGKFKDSHTVGVSGVPFAFKDRNKIKFVPTVEGELGLGYTFAAGGTSLGLQLGYRAEKWWGVSSDAPVYDFVQFTHSADQLVHGPFLRLTASFGAARPVPAAAPPPPPVLPISDRGYIVFFDFDRSTITAQAQATIDQAVAAAKTKGSARLTLTGHTDRSGSEQYNLALSLRRGEAVKAAMIRGGIPAAAIVVIGRGESVPLVPTADGVREPQNRRVEILL